MKDFIKWILIKKNENITKIRFGPSPAPGHLEVCRLHFIQNGHQKKWDVLKAYNNMNIVIYNTDTEKLVFLNQFRPSVYYNIVQPRIKEHENIDLKKYPPSIGITIELCGCFAQPGIPSTDTIKETIWKKCSYKIVPEKLEEIITYSSGVGFSSARQKLYYCEVSQKDKHDNPNKDNEVLVIESSIAEAEALLKTNELINGTVAFLFSILFNETEYDLKWSL